MQKVPYFKQFVKHSLWTFFDHITKILFISILWFLFNLPFIYSFYVFLYSRIVHPVPYLLLLVITFYSPFSFGASYYILQIVSQMVSAPKFNLLPKIISMDLLKSGLFFQGITRFFLKSLFTIFFSSLIILFFYLNLYFYWKILTPKVPVLGCLLTGIVLWAALLFFLMNQYLLAILLTRKVSFFKAFYQAFLLVIDNLFYSLSVSLLALSFCIIIAFTMLGLVIIFYGVLSLMQFLSFLIIYQKYDETIEFSTETRKLKNIFKPFK